IEDLLTIIRRGNPVNLADIRYQIEMIGQNSTSHLNELYSYEIQVFKRDKIIRPKTFGQKQILEKINTNEILFVIGPAGTGKTYLAVALAISALKKKEVDRIILVRPAVEAGESLGFLPGDLMEKIDPYFRPLYDAIYEMMPYEKFQNFLEHGIIEVAPLAYMRGRTLNNSFIILDDAQNTTLGQMKMFLTRFGFGSKIIVTGDITQVDLPQKTNSGLISIAEILKNIQGIEFIYLEKKDVVRHRLVKEIILAYENAYKYEKNIINNLEKNSFKNENKKN
ncbi:MAG TPA: PhoH family protein, partial [Atribacterota bacterium]|nr:PhoH family protein [Atribacterota bacterium]